MSFDPSADILTDNLNAVQAIYFTYHLEQVRMFQVVERIVELFRQGLLPLGGGSAGQALQRYWWADDRLTADERADLYSRALGAPGGAPSEHEVDGDFLDLWLRFVASVAMYSTQRTADALLAPPTPANARLRNAARALAGYASAHGAELTSTQRISADVSELLAVLREPEIARAFGARDMWDVIDQVNMNYLGGAVDTTRYRTQAQAGSEILQWLAAQADTLRGPDVVTTNALPADADLLQAVAQWLAVSGIQETTVEQLAHPHESGAAPTSPIDLSAIAQDLLQAAGIGSDLSGGAPKGVVLFRGSAGTGKTIAAYLLAEALSMSLMRIDLSRVVNKYIGETEKHLDAIFEDAERTGALLFFDEADALFARRTNVKDAHDRYANLDIAYLLHRIESHDGLVIVTMNQPAQTDDPCADERWRRLLRRTVRFPLPRP